MPNPSALKIAYSPNDYQKQHCLDIIQVSLMQTTSLEKLSSADAQAILERLPERIRTAMIARATEIEYPIELVVEMAIASFLDTEALGFVDCKPSRGQ